MVQVRRLLATGLALGCVLVLSLVLLGQARAQTTQRCFAETSFCIEGPFRPFWERGGLATFGFPLRPLEQAPANGSTRQQVQWFERHRLELHPANPQPYTILLGRVGAERLEQLGRDWRQQPSSSPQPGCRFFPETGRNLCPPFLELWQANGVELDGQAGVSYAESLALFGLPLTEAQEEEVEGRRYLVQWFERARFELHPESGAAGRVLLGRLGAELLAAGAGGGELVAVTPIAPAATATGAAGGQLPTATRPPPTPTRQRPRPTAQPEETAEAPEASSTSAPAPTSTAVRPTGTAVPPTAVPPTSTPRPPTATPVTPTPRPNPFTDPPPPTPPTGFTEAGGLPSQQGFVETLDGVNAFATFGSPICLGITVNGSATEHVFTVTDADGAEVLSNTVISDGATQDIFWRWDPVPNISPTGTYTVSTVADGVVISGSVTLQEPNSQSISVKRSDSTVDLDDFNNCQGTIFGEPGDDFTAVLAGFTPGTTLELYLYGTPGCAPGQAACFRGLLDTVTLDANGHAIVSIATEPEYPPGGYVILTAEQAQQDLIDNGNGLEFRSPWYQSFTLR